MLNLKNLSIYSLIFLFTLGVFAQKEVNPYNPEPKMELLKSEKGKDATEMHFLVFGDSKKGQYIFQTF